MKNEIFICYRRNSGFLMAQILKDRLEALGFHCFMDLSELKAGKFDEKILKAIEECSVFLLVLPKNGLKRCANKSDWVRKEILTAVSLQKTIIPILLEGFHWPKKWDKEIPKEIRSLALVNSITAEPEYFPAMIDKILQFLPEKIQREGSTENKAEEPLIPEDSLAFLNHAISHFGHIQSADLAFHGGDLWYRDSFRAAALEHFLRSGAKIRVLVNTTDILNNVSSGLGNPFIRYASFEENLMAWKAMEAAYPDQLEVRAAPLALLHRYYRISGSEDEAVNLRFYCYGNRYSEKDYRKSFPKESAEYSLFTDEFEYLWKSTSDQE